MHTDNGREIDFLKVINTAAENIIEVTMTSFCNEPVAVQLTGLLKKVTRCTSGFICNFIIVIEKIAYSIAYTENKTQDIKLIMEEDF